MDWLQGFEHELESAARARQLGNEGRARVCARRAAGIAVAEYYARRGFGPRGASALDLLRQLLADSAAPPATLPSLSYLMMQVDADFKLPAGVDLIAEARRLRDHLLPDA